MYAAVRFGSRTKGHADRYSDNDLLIVCQDEERKKILADYPKYNISFFSDKQLSMMKEKGSLFLQHIKRDGVILYDRGGLFYEFLQGCQFSLPSIDEIKNCETTISFINALPEEVILNNWKADFVYCVSRDYIIKKLAMNGSLAFGVDEITLLSINVFGFKIQDFDKFKRLREIKSIHRGGECLPFENEKVSTLVNDWLGILVSIFNIELNENETEIIDCLFKKEYISTYEALRCLEALYILAENTGINHVEHDKIIKYIRSPNLYKTLQSSKKKIVNNYINDVYNFLKSNNKLTNRVL